VDVLILRSTSAYGKQSRIPALQLVAACAVWYGVSKRALLLAACGVRALPFGKQGSLPGSVSCPPPSSAVRWTEDEWADDYPLIRVPVSRTSFCFQERSLNLQRKLRSMLYNPFFFAEPVREQEPHEQKVFTFVTSCPVSVLQTVSLKNKCSSDSCNSLTLSSKVTHFSTIHVSQQSYSLCSQNIVSS
jgi:hypothetical protein